MRKRTRAREFALQVLYKIDITAESCEDSLANFWQSGAEQDAEDEIKQFAADLVRGVTEKLSAIDEKISQYATNWRLDRMAFVDRNILRLGCYELLFRQDIPPKVSINEAVELAKKYSTQEAAKFVNGILDKVKAEKEK
jgi:N utilization substance protein B